MKEKLTILLALILLASCGLSSSQESKLNHVLGTYIKANNEKNSLVLIGLTHPTVVDFYQSQSDTLFLTHFITDNEYKQLLNPFYITTLEDGEWIERVYSVKINNYLSKKTQKLFVISEDHGENWFVVTQKDYFNKSIPLRKHLYAKTS